MNKCISPKGGSIALILSIRMNGADTLAGDHLPLRSLQSVKNIPTEPAGISLSSWRVALWDTLTKQGQNELLKWKVTKILEVFKVSSFLLVPPIKERLFNRLFPCVDSKLCKKKNSLTTSHIYFVLIIRCHWSLINFYWLKYKNSRCHGSLIIRK